MTEGRGDRRRAFKSFALALALLAPIALTPIASRAIVDHIAQAAGAGLASLSASLEQTHHDQTPPEPALEPQRSGAEPSLLDVEREARGLPSSRARARGRGERAESESENESPHPRGILVRADVVARAARSGSQPSGAPVPATGMRPGGVALYGVSAFGAGLLDGDVVTAVGGANTTSAGMVIAAVAGAVRSGARAISAVIWRDQQPIRVTVEIPLLTARGPSDGAR